MMLCIDTNTMISPPPLYCQFIHSESPEQKQNKNSIDPPRIDDNNNNNNNNRKKNAQRSNRNKRQDRYKTQLQVLEENSYEGTKSRASKNSLELNPNRRVIPKRRVDNPQNNQQYPLPKKKHEKIPTSRKNEGYQKKKHEKIPTSRTEGYQKKNLPDPPTSKRRPDERKKQLGGGQDPPVEKSSKRNKQREVSGSSKSKTSGSGDKRRSSRATTSSKSRKRSSFKSRTSRHRDTKDIKKKEGPQVKPKPIQSILKKKEVPPPAYFGVGAQSVASSSNSANNNDDKPPSNSSDDASFSLASTKSASESMNNSAIRRGRYAAKTLPSTNINTTSDDDSSTIISVISAGSDSDDELDNFQFDRNKCHFIRTSDLGLTQDTIFAEQFLDDPTSSAEAHYHHPSPHPPPGIKFNIDENWVTITDGKGSYSPISPQVVDALVATGYRSATDHQMWTPTKGSRKYMTEKRLTFDSLPIPGPIYEGLGGAHDLNCLLWSGKFHHRHWGSELALSRAQGFINMSAESLVDLLMDSRRVLEYNKTSKGRIDEYFLSSGSENCPFSKKKKKLTGVVIQGTKVVDGCAFMEDTSSGYGSEGEGSSSSSRRRQKISKYVGTTKLVRTKNKLPLVRRPLEFISLLHCRELTEEQGGNGYIIVGRSITPAEDDKKSVIRSEMLLNVIIIRRLHENNKGSTRNTVAVSDSGRVAPRRDLRNRCLMITLSHIKSPLIPKVLSKQVVLSALKSFFMDIRGCR